MDVDLSVVAESQHRHRRPGKVLPREIVLLGTSFAIVRFTNLLNISG